MTAAENVLEKHPELVLKPSAKLRDAIKVMTDSRVGIALVADGSRRLLGVVTDIDIRKALLNRHSMESPIARAMTREPLTVSDQASREEIAAAFRRNARSYLPVVDAKRRLKGMVALLDYVTIPKRYPNWIVVMAGGAGKRLRPLTDKVPKPLVRIGDKPILELLVDQLVASGFGRFIFTVNYLAEQIKDYCGNGERWGVQIEYVHESRPLGTAGALGLIKRDLGGTFLVVNGDILTKVNFSALLNFHKTEKALATICIKQHEIQVPYGVIELQDHKLERFVEKPVQRYYVNAGIYAFEPDVLSRLPRNAHCDMPELLQRIRARKPRSVACFPLQEYWLDVGRPQDHDRATNDYRTEFKHP